MTIIQSITLAIIQGITEFLPISSSGHLIIIPKIFNWPLQSLAFDVTLHMGTLTAVIVYFRQEISRLIKSIINYKNPKFRLERRLIFLIVIGILPAIIAGLILNNAIEYRFRTINIVIINLTFWGLFLIAADYWADRRVKSSDAKTGKLTSKGALSIGIFQVFSLFPGTSRSGVTITAGIFNGLTPNQSARFSFLMSIPLILGAVILKSADLFSQSQTISTSTFVPLIIGFLISAIIGWLAIKFLMKLLNSWGLKIFGFYRLILAIILIIL